ncbi:MAG TPA: EpsI family protein [Gemmatimonadales bacterium]|nr:EpsI family protein [Gemmatimonadales bacterium]
MADRSAWVPGSLLAIGCMLLFGVDRQHEMPLAAPLDSLPATLSRIAGTAVPVDQAEQQVAGMSSYVMRQYDDSVAPFTVYVAYYSHQTQGKTIHSPKNCLPGSGWDALQQSVVSVQTPAGPRRVNRYLLQNGEQRALVFYWYQGRGRVASGEYQVKWDLLRDAALRGRTEEALVRVLVWLTPTTDLERADARARSVTVELIPEVDRVLPAW